MRHDISQDDLSKLTISIGSDAADVPRVLPLVRQMHKESIFSDMPFDAEQYEKICSFIIDIPSRHGGVFVEYENEPVAFAYFVHRPFMGSRMNYITYMHTIYLRGDIRSTPLGGYIWERIIMAVRGWSAPRSSKGLMFNVVSGIAIEESDTVLRANGGTFLGGNYFIRI